MPSDDLPLFVSNGFAVVVHFQSGNRLIRTHVRVASLGRRPIEFGRGGGFGEHVARTLGGGLFGVFVPRLCHRFGCLGKWKPSFVVTLLGFQDRPRLTNAAYSVKCCYWNVCFDAVAVRGDGFFVHSFVSTVVVGGVVTILQGCWGPRRRTNTNQNSDYRKLRVFITESCPQGIGITYEWF